MQEEKSSGSDSLHIIPFLFRHEQQRSLHPCGTLPSLHLQYTRLMLALGLFRLLQQAEVGCASLLQIGESDSACFPQRKPEPVIPNRLNMPQLPLQEITMSPLYMSLTSVACSIGGNNLEVFLSRLSPSPNPFWGKLLVRKPTGKFVHITLSYMFLSET